MGNLLLLVLVANGAPIVVKWVLGNRFHWALDGGLRLYDGNPLFGPKKTIRGLAGAVLATEAVALLLGMAFGLGALIGASAMAGDLVSSFIKRRMGLSSSEMAPLLDHLPESFLPTVIAGPSMGLSTVDMVIVVALFQLVQMPLSLLLFKLRIRETPH